LRRVKELIEVVEPAAAPAAAGILLKEPGLLRHKAYVGGAWVDADGGAAFDVLNPATGELLSTMPRLGVAETRRAIEAAADAYPEWRALLAKERARIMKRWADLLLEHLDDLALLLTAEQGKPLVESEAEIVYAASFLEWFGEEAKRVYGDTIPTYLPDRRVVVLKQPIGVSAGITPWNFPVAMPTRKCAPALAAGNTMVLKPAEQTPLTALAVAKLAEEAGLPVGVLSVVTGDAADAPTIGGELTSNPIVRKVGFTGSTEVGKLLMEQCSRQLKKISLELGGNAPFIVFDDAQLDAAVAGTVVCKYRNSGQTCISANRILVQDGIYDDYLEKLVESVTRLKVGSGTEAGVSVGPIIDEAGFAKVRRHVEDAVDGGAQLLSGGKPHELGRTFFEPTVLVDVRPEMAMAREETFGPVAGITRFSTEEEAVRVANDTPYGLAAYFYSRDVGRVWRVSEALDYGIVGINTGFISTEVAPFGGMKESGIGREGSKYGIDDWVEIKYLAIAGMDS
jgi:succinate-semialdehyde dehydrogenase / glutarate-semialdehyde dehydrogenase